METDLLTPCATPHLAVPPRHRLVTPLGDDGASLSSHVWPLQPAWDAILRDALALGPVRVRAGDSLCQWEQHTQAQPAAGRAATGLRADTTHWAQGMALQARLADGRMRRGFRFFNHAGQEVLALDLSTGASPDAFHQAVRRHTPSVWRAAPTGAADMGDGLADAPAAPPGPAAASGLGTVDSLARPLTRDTVLDLLQHASRARLPMSAGFHSQGVQLDWQGLLHPLAWQDGATLASSNDLTLHWPGARPGLDAWLLCTPTAAGLVQALALATHDGGVRLKLSPDSPPSRPQPCAWRTAILAVCGGGSGTAC
jgi:putative heme degradation protein